MGPLECFWLNVKFWVLEFLITKIQHMSQSYFISANFAMAFLFRSELPPKASNFELQNIFKSPAKIIPFFQQVSKLFSRLWSSSKIFTCSVLILASYRFIRIYWSTSSVISKIKILPAFSVSCSLSTKEFLSR